MAPKFCGTKPHQELLCWNGQSLPPIPVCDKVQPVLVAVRTNARCVRELQRIRPQGHSLHWGRRHRHDHSQGVAPVKEGAVCTKRGLCPKMTEIRVAHPAIARNTTAFPIKNSFFQVDTRVNKPVKLTFVFAHFFTSSTRACAGNLVLLHYRKVFLVACPSMNRLIFNYTYSE